MRRSIFADAFYLGLTELLLRSISLVFRLYLSSEIGVAGLGLLQLIFTAASFGLTLALSGLRTASMYLFAEEIGCHRNGGVRRALQLCLRLALALSIFVGAAFYVLSDPIADCLLGDIRAAGGLRIFALGLPISACIAIFSGYLTVFGKVRLLAVIEMIEQLFSVLLTMLLLPLANDLSESCGAILLGGLLASVISFIWLAVLVRSSAKKLGRAQRGLHMAMRLRTVCVPLALGGYLRSGLSTIEHILIPRGLSAFSSKQTALSTYGIIHGMVFPVIMFPSAVLFAVSDLLVAELARCRAANMQLRIRHITSKALRFGFLFSASTAVILYALRNPLAKLVCHDPNAALYLRIFSPMVLFLYLDAIVDAVCKGLGQQKINVRYNIITSVVDIVLLLVLLPKIGVPGYVLAFLISHLLNFCLSLRLLLRLTEHRPDLSFLLRASFSAVVGAGAIACVPFFFSDLLRIVMGCLAFAVVFALMLRLSRTLSPGDRIWLRQIFEKSKHQKSHDLHLFA